MAMFSTVLVANRGEIAVRIMRSLRSLGIRTVAVYSDADRSARHVHEADHAIWVGPAPARESYLRIDRIVDAALTAGADALHPGYGFLSENPLLAEVCEATGLVFIGPPASAIRAMGDKISAKRTVAAAGVRVVPGGGAAGMTDTDLVLAAQDVGFPVLIKPSAGGGGKGMRLVRTGEGTDLVEALASARREALSSFGDDALLVERFIENPRHIEIQVLADTYGTVLHLGERECSLQRRHQKIIEEAPSPFITPEVRAAMGSQAVAAAAACGYVGAGTIEMIVSGDNPDDFFFMEMNTRLQVEHPVTEMVYGIDLVEWQVRIAAGESLPWQQRDLAPRGHAIEARLYAEDPARGFLPTGGTVLGMREPRRPAVRVDSGIAVGSVVGSDYDPMLAKVIAHGADRATALRRLDAALAETIVVGVPTNVGFLRSLLADERVVAGELNTGLVEERLAELVGDGTAPTEVIAAAAFARLGVLDDISPDPWADRRGWRLGGPAWTRQRLIIGGQVAEVAVRSCGDRWDVAVDGFDPVEIGVRRVDDSIVIDGPQGAVSVLVAERGQVTYLANGHGSWEATLDTRLTRSMSGGAAEYGAVRSPMPGSVLEVRVSVGDAVASGQPLAVVEAMKMEHTLFAAGEGVVTAVHVTAGQQVALHEPLVTIGPREAMAA